MGHPPPAPAGHGRDPDHGRAAFSGRHRRPHRTRAGAGSLELERGFAPSGLLDANEVLAENRFIAARDATAGELIDPVRGTLVPIARLLDELLAAARPHAGALDALDELEDVRTLVLASEPQRQEKLAATAGLPVLVADLAARFAA